MSTGSQYVRAGAIARVLGMRERTIRRWIASGELPSIKVGGARLVAKSDLEVLLGRSDSFGDEDEDEDEKEDRRINVMIIMYLRVYRECFV